jgi:hypothetical protein
MAMPALAPEERPPEDEEEEEVESEETAVSEAAVPATSVAVGFESAEATAVAEEDSRAVPVAEAAAPLAVGDDAEFEAVAAAAPLDRACVDARAYMEAAPLVLWTVKSGPTTKLATLSESCNNNEQSTGYSETVISPSIGVRTYFPLSSSVFHDQPTVLLRCEGYHILNATSNDFVPPTPSPLHVTVNLKSNHDVSYCTSISSTLLISNPPAGGYRNLGSTAVVAEPTFNVDDDTAAVAAAAAAAAVSGASVTEGGAVATWKLPCGLPCANDGRPNWPPPDMYRSCSSRHVVVVVVVVIVEEGKSDNAFRIVRRGEGVCRWEQAIEKITAVKKWALSSPPYGYFAKSIQTWRRLLCSERGR